MHQHCLQRLPPRADFIEKQCAIASFGDGFIQRGFRTILLPFIGTKHHQRLGSTGTVAVNHLRGQTLAAARRALQQDGHVVAAGLGDDGKGTLHGLAVADHGRFSTLLALHRHEDFTDRPLEIGQVERLEEILTRPKTASLQGGVQRAVGSDDHHRRRCRQRLDFLQHFQSAHVRQADIENDECVGLRRQLVDPPLP